MLPLSVNKSNQGFTLLETATVVVVIGILAAISAPSLLGWYNRTKVNSAMNEVRGALQQAQREAMRKSKPCTVTLGTSDNPPTVSAVNSSGDSCVINRELQNGVEMSSNIDSSGSREIEFNIRGGTGDRGKIVLHMADASTQEKKCIVLSAGIGLMRSGNYSGNTDSDSDITNGECTTSR